ncbi:MAG: hypothetical protein IAF02_23925 [Anaerolineae bacterium]|nr:hypothetical protein [Anaerolineae bacterium]
MAAVLLVSGFNFYAMGEHKTAVCFFSLSVLLLAAALHHFYWLIIWDSTSDGLSYLWLFVPIIGVLLATIWLVLKLPYKMKPAAFFYLLLLPLALIIITRQAQRVDFRQLTYTHAERISQALTAYHAQEGSYPEELRQLIPGYLLTLSEPVIIFGQEWCYEGYGDSFQFGFVDREHWSDPRLFAHHYSESAENAATLPALCEQEIIALQARDPQYYRLQNE